MFISSQDEFEKKENFSKKYTKVFYILLAILGFILLTTLILEIVFDSIIIEILMIVDLFLMIIMIIPFILILAPINKDIKEYKQRNLGLYDASQVTTIETQYINKQHRYYINNKDRIRSLTEKYSQSVYNFVKQLNRLSHRAFSFIEDTEELLLPYWKGSSQLFKIKLRNDGFKEFNDKTKTVKYQNIEELTTVFINGLKTRIIKDGEWPYDQYSFHCVIYEIVRNNIIHYYHDYYKNNIGWETIEDYYKNEKDKTNNLFYFTCYYIYEKSIELYLMPTYNKFLAEIERIKQQKIENSLFNQSINETVVNIIKDDNSISSKQILTIEDQIDNMSGEEFEKFMEQYFISKGYNVIRTPLSGDYGIDLIIEHEFGKIGIQLKRYNDKVSLSAVQEVVAGLNHYGLNSGMVITNNYFQPSAIRLAKDNNITLWDRDVLLEKTRI